MIQSMTFNGFDQKSYIISSDSSECVIVDPGCTVEERQSLETALQAKKPVAILLTHAHPDHLFGVKYLVDKYACPVYLHPKDKKTLPLYADMFDKLLQMQTEIDFETIDIEDNQVLELGGLTFKIIYTPGHSVGSVSYLCEQESCIFTGDTLFCETIGRTDLPGGEYDDLIRSIMEKLILLDPALSIYPGHGRPSSIAHERTHNPFLEPFNEVESSTELSELDPIIINH